MRGVWYTTGGSAGATIAAAAAVAIVGAEWVIAHLWVILAVGVLCAVGTAVAVHRLIVGSDRRAVRVWAQRPVQLRAEQVTEISRPQRRAIAPVHIHFHGLPDAEQAAIIRQTISREPGA